MFDAALSRLTLVEPDRWESIPASARVTVSVHGPAMVTNLVRRGDDGFLAAGFFGEGRLGHFTAGGEYEGATGAIPISDFILKDLNRKAVRAGRDLWLSSEGGHDGS